MLKPLSAVEAVIGRVDGEVRAGEGDGVVGSGRQAPLADGVGAFVLAGGAAEATTEHGGGVTIDETRIAIGQGGISGAVNLAQRVGGHRQAGGVDSEVRAGEGDGVVGFRPTGSLAMA